MRVRGALVLLVLSSIACDPEVACDAASLRTALAGASPGDEVELRCRVEGAFVVPAGVTLTGTGDAAIMLTDANEVALEVMTGDQGDTVVQGLTVESAGRAAIAVRGAGTAVLERAVVRATAGIGVGTSGATVTIRASAIEGEVTPDTIDESRWLRVIGSAPPDGECPTAECECRPGARDGSRTCDTTGRWATLTATHGLYVRGGTLELVDTTITQHALFAVVLEDASATISGGTIGHGLGVGLEVLGGTVAIDGTEITGVHTGLRGSPSYAALFAEDAAATTTGLRVRGVDGYGLVHAGGTGVHQGLVIEETGDVALWAGGSERIEVRGPGARIADAAFAAVLGVEVGALRLEDVDVVGVRALRRVVGARGAIDVGDGVQLIATVPSLEAVRIVGAERAGLVVDLVSGVDATAFREVSVDASGTALGAIAGTVDVATEALVAGAPAGWDTGVTRAGAAAANDAAFAGALPAVVAATPPSAGSVVGAIGPMY